MQTIPDIKPARVNRSAAARKAWETRRAAAIQVGRSAAANKAWVSRRAAAVPVNERAEYIRHLRVSMRGAISLARARQAKRAAEGKRAVAVTVTVAELMTKLAAQDYRCAISGLPFYTDDADRFGPACPSLDRINADGDYSDENVRVVYLGINSLRGRGSDADVLRIASAIVANERIVR
ncbi:hypothetical protein BH160DRAFT_5745 [Burkholderia sp. H160]|nr:hypothetical protein BH160DRAFT_5745 [Burkholderia sp. H160]